MHGNADSTATDSTAQSAVKVSDEKAESETITVPFQSIKGVMNELSCYCYNGGFLTTESGERIAVCITNEDSEITCEKVSFTGHYETIERAADATSPCPGGEREVFVAESFVCK